MCARPVAAVGASLLPALRIRAAFLAVCKARVAPPAALLASGGGTLRQRRAMAAAAGTRPADAAAVSTASEGSDIDPRAAQLLQALAIPPPPDYQLFKGSWVEHVLAPREGLLSEIVTEALRLPQVRPQYSAAASHCPLRAVGQAEIEMLGFLPTQLLRTWVVRWLFRPTVQQHCALAGLTQLLVLLLPWSGCDRAAAAIWGGAHLPGAPCCATGSAGDHASSGGGGGARTAAGSTQGSRQRRKLEAGHDGWQQAEALLHIATRQRCTRVHTATIQGSLLLSSPSVQPACPLSHLLVLFPAALPQTEARTPQRVTEDLVIPEHSYVRIHLMPKRFPAAYSVSWAVRAH